MNKLKWKGKNESYQSKMTLSKMKSWYSAIQ